MTALAPMLPPKGKLSRRAGWAKGQPISRLMAQALANPDLISLAAGFVDQATLPVEPTARAFEKMFSVPAAAKASLQYGTTHGYPPLRRALLDHAIEADGLSSPDLSLDQVVLTAGSNQLLHLITESLLDPGDVVLCATPSYFVYLGAVANAGGVTYGVESDDEGIIPEALDETLARFNAMGELARVKAVYLVPYFDNPGGITMPDERRRGVVEVVQRWSHESKLYLIEDSAYRPLRYFGEDTPGMRAYDEDGDTVIVAGTFSKSYSPGIRVGWGILPTELIAPICEQKGNIDFGSPNFSQHLMAGVLEGGDFEPHVETLCDAYRIKLEAMLAAADEHLAPISGVHWVSPRGGLYVWVELPEEIEAGPSGRLFDTAVEQGVLYVPGQYCFSGDGELAKANTMRLSFGVQSPERIREGIAALARAIREVA